MAVRALDLSSKATQHRFTVSTGNSVSKGRAVLLDGADNEVDEAGAASDLAVGIAAHDAAAGKPVDVYLFGPVVPTKVGTGGATRGTKVVLVADGVTDAPAHDSDGTGNQAVYGIAMQTGPAGDMIGVMLAPSNRGS